jgi:16S rRNA (guanine527-N7)-methyltransferase
VVATPGLTSLRNIASAREALLEDALRGVPIVQRCPGAIVDVGSGGGSPGIPLAATLTDRSVTLLESQQRKARFLARWGAELPNLSVVCGRAESQPTGTFGVAVAKALAPPAVAAELCLPLVRQGGTVVLWVGPTVDLPKVARVARLLTAEVEETPPGFVVLRRVGPLPAGFPRRPGMAAKRPL